MTWNYRVMRHDDSADGEPYFCIHEVFYDEGGGKPGWTEDAIAVQGESIAEMRQQLEWMALALDKPVLSYATGEEVKSWRSST